MTRKGYKKISPPLGVAPYLISNHPTKIRLHHWGDTSQIKFILTVSPWGTKGLGTIQTMIALANRFYTFGVEWQDQSGEKHTDSSLIVQNSKYPREGFRAQRRIYFLFYYKKTGSFRNRKMRKLFFKRILTEFISNSERFSEESVRKCLLDFVILNRRFRNCSPIQCTVL